MLKMEHIRAAFPEGCLAANLSLIPIPNPAKAQKRKLNGFTIKIDAISSREIRFYKVDVNKDYTYPNNQQEPSIITVTSE